MKTSIKYITLIPIIIVLSDMLINLGEKQPAWTLGIEHFYTGAFVLVGAWYMGYISGKEE